MTFELAPFEEKHLEEAAVLIAQRFQQLLHSVPALPPRYSQADPFVPLLQGITKSNAGLVALQQGRLIGFLCGWRVQSADNRNRVYIPEWANGVAIPELTFQIIEQLYSALSTSWVAEGYLRHAVSSFANDRDTKDAWHWLGFSLLVVDAIRDLTALEADTEKMCVRRAGLAELEQVLEFDQGLVEYLKTAPMFLPGLKPHSRQYFEDFLQKPDYAIWLGFETSKQTEKAVAYLKLGLADPNVSTIIFDEKTTSISGAFTLPEARGKGAATRLLNRALEWARAEGYERVAVDFETLNPLATQFWLKHFQPVTYSQVRRIETAAELG
jgi:GNAT superfamily N-acetyltransferase